MTIKFDGGLTCSIGVTDLDRAIQWYADIMGATLLYRADEIAWCEMQSAVARVTIGLSELETVERGGGATLTFGVEDIEQAKAVLDAKDVRQDGPFKKFRAWSDF